MGVPRQGDGKRRKKNKKHLLHGASHDEGFIASEETGRRKLKRRPPSEGGNRREKVKGKQRREEKRAEEVETGKNKKQKLRQQERHDAFGLNDVVRAEEDVKMEKKMKMKMKTWKRPQEDQAEDGALDNTVEADGYAKRDGRSKKWATRGRGEGRGQRGGGRRNLITDPRFASAHSDPRFQRMPQRESKITIDSRFSRLFSENSFASSSAPVDKRGRPRKEKAENRLLRYYVGEEEAPALAEDNEEEDDEASGSDKEAEPSTSEREGSSGSGVDTDTSSSTDEDDDDNDESDEENTVDSEVYTFWMANQEDTPTIENETRRLAVVNMDWDHIKAVDLFVLMSTCLLTSPQSTGQILSVAVYPSEFGLKCMEIEAARGPHALFDDEKDDDDDDGDDTDDEIVNEKIRSYQLKRLKYYYAVAECDSSATANHLYKVLDGVEFLSTANVMDLRFIPDSTEFKHPPRDIATEIPSGYKQPNFETFALQHSAVKLTWDDDEPNRKKILRRKFNPDQMDELEQYLASDVSDDDNDDNDNDDGHREKYHALLQSANASGTDEDNDSGKEMEVTFLPGVENLSKHIDNNKLSKSDEGVWEATLRKRREKMKARRKSSKFSSEDDSSDSEYHEAPHQPDDFFEEHSDPEAKDGKNGTRKGSLKAVNKSRRKDGRFPQDTGREDEKGEEASRAELELLMANDDATNERPKGFNLRPKKVKGKKRKGEPMENALPDVDANSDPRLSSRLTSHVYALDPTDPQYKRSAAGMRRERAQKQRKGSRRVAAAEGEERTSHPTSNQKQSKENYDIMSLVRSVKLKSKAFDKNGIEDAEE